MAETTGGGVATAAAPARPVPTVAAEVPTTAVEPARDMTAPTVNVARPHTETRRRTEAQVAQPQLAEASPERPTAQANQQARTNPAETPAQIPHLEIFLNRFGLSRERLTALGPSGAQLTAALDQLVSGKKTEGTQQLDMSPQEYKELFTRVVSELHNLGGAGTLRITPQNAERLRKIYELIKKGEGDYSAENIMQAMKGKVNRPTDAEITNAISQANAALDQIQLPGQVAKKEGGIKKFFKWAWWIMAAVFTLGIYKGWKSSSATAQPS